MPTLQCPHKNEMKTKPQPKQSNGATGMMAAKPIEQAIIEADERRCNSFPHKLFRLIQDQEADCIAWLPTGDGFTVTNREELLKHFEKQSTWPSFRRQLSMWQFKR